MSADGHAQFVYISIPEDAAVGLRDLARRERRSPREQAAVLVLAALDLEGTSPEPQPDGERAPRARSAATKAEA